MSSTTVHYCADDDLSKQILYTALSTQNITFVQLYNMRFVLTFL